MAKPRIAAIHLGTLPLETVFLRREATPEGTSSQAEELERSRLSRLETCALRAPVRGRSTIISVSEAAFQVGVRIGMSEAEARATRSELIIRDREPALELILLERAAEILFAYGPDVEVCPPDLLFVEIGRSQSALRRRWGHLSEEDTLKKMVRDFESIGHSVTAALADDADTARSLAEHLGRAGVRCDSASPCGHEGRQGGASSPKEAPSGSGFWIAPPGRSRFALATLPIEALAWMDHSRDPEGQMRARLHGACDALRTLGIRRVRGLLKFSSKELGNRFGAAGVCLAQRARGQSCRPLRKHSPPELLEESFELDAATEDLEPILFILRRLLHRLEVRLEARQQAASGITLDFQIEPSLDSVVRLEERRPGSSQHRELLEVRLARPTRSAATLFSIARERLGQALPGAVLAIRVIAQQPEPDRGAQLDLFSRRAQKVEALGELVGRLSAALGETSVMSPRLCDTHRPEKGWASVPFSVEEALAPLPSTRKQRQERVVGPMVALSARGQDRVLPSIDEHLSVVAPAIDRENESLDPKLWPKPKPRRSEDEIPPPLPPRPLELFEAPEPAALSGDQSILSWRGKRIPLRAVSGLEHLRTEWWCEGPLERDYIRIETEDGRLLWMYRTPDGACYLHGVFD